MPEDKPKLGIFAGGGPLPRRVAEAGLEGGREIFIIAFDGQTDRETVDNLPHAWMRMGAVGRIFDRLHAEGVEDLCMIGHFRRPSLREAMPDLRGSRVAARIGLNSGGDDTLLRAIGDVLTEEGFRIIGAQEVLKDLLARPGVLTKRQPDEQDRADVARALQVARAIGALDVGQGAVVQQGLVLAVEAAEGTDAMLTRCGPLRREGGGGVLVKTSKPQQDRRLDLPVIGVSTVEAAASAGLVGIAVVAGGALIHDARAVADAADRLGLFVVCLEESA